MNSKESIIFGCGGHSSVGRRFNSTYPKVAVQWLNQALCFNQSLCLVESEVLRNRHLRVAAKRCEQCKRTIMKSILSLFIIAVIILTGCKADSESEVENKEPIKINPLDRLGQVDRLLSELSEKPQQFEVPSNRETEVFGAKGTLIHVDPNRLETIDGTPLGDKIQIELLEMTDNSNMLLNNTQTVSNGQILVTGGAYHLNMTSDEKQLKMKQH